MNTSLNVRATLRAARRRLVVPVLGLGIGLAAAQPVTHYLPATYEASASMVITASTTDPTTKARVPDLTLAQNLLPTVAQLAQSREVARDTAAALRLPPGAVEGHVTGAYQQGTQIVTIRATAGGGAEAAAIANGATESVVRQFGLLQIGAGGNVATRFLDRATAPTVPRSPNRRLADALGAFAGLLAGLWLSWLSGRVDDRLREPARLGAELGLPVLGVFPRLPGRYARRHARTLYTRRSVADAVGATVAALTVLTGSLPCRRLLVTSVHDDDGKGLVSALLALALADGQGPVTLVEGQPGRPAVGGHFPEAAACTLQKAVASGGTAAPLPGSTALSVIVAAARQKRTNPEPVSGRQIGGLMNTLAGNGGAVIVHAPPVLAGADLAVLSRYGDGVVLVVETGITRRAEAIRAAMLIQRMNLPVVGVVAIDAAGDADGARYPVGFATAPTAVSPTAAVPMPAMPMAVAPAIAGSPVTGVPAVAPAARPVPTAVAPTAVAPRVVAPTGGVSGVTVSGVTVPGVTVPGVTVPGVTVSAVGAPTAVAPARAGGAPNPVAPDVGGGAGDAHVVARHRRRDSLDALSAPFQSVVTQTLELAALVDGDTQQPGSVPQNPGGGHPYAGATPGPGALRSG
jgi:capsular polysaccharide biosynthesis protein